MKKLVLCIVCFGTGRIAEINPHHPDEYFGPKFVKCHACRGSGRVWEIKTFEPYTPEEKD